MKAREFCYWLQGFFELEAVRDPGSHVGLSVDQVRCIRQHLALAFKHDIDPSAGPPSHQAELNAIHEGSHVSPQVGGQRPDGTLLRC